MKQNKKKAQLQLGENVVVLVIFFFLLVIAVIFYSRIQIGRIAAKNTEYSSASLLDLKTMVAAMPEILCTENNDITEGCIDVINLGIMKQYWERIKQNETSPERAYYIYRLGTSQITVKRLDPMSGLVIDTWALYDNTIGMNYSRPVYIPVSLYNATSDDYSFGFVELRRFSRT